MSVQTGIAPSSRLTVPLALSLAVVVLLVAAAVPGIFVSGLYRDTSSVVTTDRGSDLFTLIAVVPALAVSLYYSRRGSLRAQIIWLALVAWAGYNYIVYAYGVNFTSVSLVHVAIMSLAIFALVFVIRAVDVASLGAQFKTGMPRAVVAVYLWLVAAIFTFLWLADTIPASLNSSTPTRLVALHTTSNPVEINDLAIVIPSLIIAGVLTWQRRPLGYLLSGVLLGLATVTMVALVPGGPIFGGQAPDPIYTGVAVVSAIVWVAVIVNVGSALRDAVNRPSGTKTGTRTVSA